MSCPIGKALATPLHLCNILKLTGSNPEHPAPYSHLVTVFTERANSTSSIPLHARNILTLVGLNPQPSDLDAGSLTIRPQYFGGGGGGESTGSIPLCSLNIEWQVFRDTENTEKSRKLITK